MTALWISLGLVGFYALALGFSYLLIKVILPISD